MPAHRGLASVQDLLLSPTHSLYTTSTTFFFHVFAYLFFNRQPVNILESLRSRAFCFSITIQIPRHLDGRRGGCVLGGWTERDRKREKGKREKDKQKETNMRTMIQLFIFLGEGGSFSVVERKRCISKHFLVLGRADSVLGWSFNFFGFSLFFF
jgi:hypothetical protein